MPGLPTEAREDAHFDAPHRRFGAAGDDLIPLRNFASSTS